MVFGRPQGQHVRMCGMLGVAGELLGKVILGRLIYVGTLCARTLTHSHSLSLTYTHRSHAGHTAIPIMIHTS